MELELKRTSEPFGLELKNELGFICPIDGKSDIGGKNGGFRPMELLAGSLAACASIDVLLILKKQKIEVLDYSIHIEAERVDGVPSPFKEITLGFEIDLGDENSTENIQKIERAIQLSVEKYCSVTASLDSKISIKTTLKLR